MTPIITGKTIPDPLRAAIQSIMIAANVPSLLISSYQRTPASQASAMFDNALNKGAQSQFDLYAAAGDQVIQVWKDAIAKLKPEICAEMEAKIVLIGPSKVSHHCIDDSAPYWVVDIAPSSIPDPLEPAFVAACRADPRCIKLLTPQEHAGEPAFHLELRK